ncbi:MAG: hypothetical protein HZA00_08890 [Nitrospinae bacterium]|nr:hypothetical protein [Nitrospinota bacterium]
MKKIAVITLLVFISFKSDISHSAPDRNIQGLAPERINQGQASDEIEDIKEKVSTLEEEISFLEKEISRDKDISSWVQNTIALRTTRDYLKRDLPEKKRILDNLKKDFGDELKDEIGFIEQNIEKEKEIVAGVLIDIGTIKYTQAYIQENLPRKNDLLKIFKEKLEELKTKLEKVNIKEKVR